MAEELVVSTSAGELGPVVFVATNSSSLDFLVCVCVCVCVCVLTAVLLNFHQKGK